ncbi:MAG: L-threonylcarbamoyladenylate synthase [Desulfobacterales bacterium]
MRFKSKTVVQVDPEHPADAAVMQAVALVRAGGVIAFPTRCLYGLGADAFNAEAVARIFRIKQRPLHNPILILIDRPERLDRLVSEVSPAAARIMDRFWPGRITLVFRAGDNVPSYLTAGSGKIGIRLPGHPVAAALVNALQTPLTGTSANLSGRPGCRRIEDLEFQIAGKLDLILDAGPLQGGRGSTIVDVTVDPPKILREGEVSGAEITTLLK